MALEQIKGERVIKALKPGAGRLNDGAACIWCPSHGARATTGGWTTPIRAAAGP